MLTPRLVRRCGSARAIGPAFVEGHDVAFAKKSTVDLSGKATLSAGEASLRQYGVLFEIARVDLDNLDREEGAGTGYDRIDRFPVVHAASKEIEHALTYVASLRHDGLKPYDWYLALVVQGAIEHGLPEAQIDRFRSTPCIPDPDPARKRRQEALDVLQAAGCSDPLAILVPTGSPERKTKGIEREDVEGT